MRTLRDALGCPAELAGSRIEAAGAGVALADVARGTSLGGELARLAGRSVLVLTRDQLSAALALLDLDGLARRIVLCPPDLQSGHRSAIVAGAEVDAIVSDLPSAELDGLDVPIKVGCGLPIIANDGRPEPRGATEWLLLTSGTTGVPKLVMHSLAGLTGAIRSAAPPDPRPVWATFYDIRRYGGLQIFFRAMLGRASLVLSSAGEPIVDHLSRLAALGVTHISGTPSHWRRALMSSAATRIPAQYVRLSGEIADQAILDSLHQTYPQAAIGHAYASTEAGVGFEVTDGLEGLPAGLVGRRGGAVEIKVEDDTLRLRSSRTATCYVGQPEAALGDAEGFVDTDDIVERRGERYYFVGRRGGIINVGGLKVHPEEVEAVINRHAGVRMSLVKPRKSPIIGAVVTADVVLTEAAVGEAADGDGEQLKEEILQTCRETLAAHKIPAVIRFVPALEVTPAGKLARRHA
jgi:acyl-coenzyme A synthetase/AMP-(fatty) acid ligase